MKRKGVILQARADHEALRAKLTQMESKLIVGGENVLEKAEQQVE